MDINAIKNLLSEYRQAITASPVEKGGVYAELASLYLKINNQLLDFYNSFLEKALIDFKTLNSREKELT